MAVAEFGGPLEQYAYALSPLKASQVLRRREELRASCPNIYEMLKKDSLAEKYVPQLVKKAWAYPLKAEVLFHQTMVRSGAALKAQVGRALQPAIAGTPWENDALDTRIVDAIGAVLVEEIEKSVKQAEQERNMFDWLFRQNVANRMHLASNFHVEMRPHQAVLSLGGFAELERVKAELGGHDMLRIAVQMKITALILDKQKLDALDRDPVLLQDIEGCSAMDDLWA